MTTLEQVRTRIVDHFSWNGNEIEITNYAVKKCLEIIDKYAEQEPTDITTEYAVKTIQELMIACTPDSKYYRVGQMAISAMLENEELSKDLDEALKEIDEYEQGLEQEPCDDVVSRQAVLDVIYGQHIGGKEAVEHGLRNTYAGDLREIADEIIALPSVRPQEQISHWIDKEFRKEEYVLMGKCSVCGRVRVIDEYCPNCGCRMVEPQESEDKE